jgi:hypothetical protein
LRIKSIISKIHKIIIVKDRKNYNPGQRAHFFLCALSRIFGGLFKKLEFFKNYLTGKIQEKNKNFSFQNLSSKKFYNHQKKILMIIKFFYFLR